MNFKLAVFALFGIVSIISLHSTTLSSQEIRWNNYSKLILNGIDNLVIKPDEHKEQLTLEADESTLKNIIIDAQENYLTLATSVRDRNTQNPTEPVKEKNKIKATLYLKNLNNLLIEAYEPLTIEIEGPLWGKNFQVIAKDSLFGGITQGGSMILKSSTNMSGNCYRLSGLFGSFRISHLTLYVNHPSCDPLTSLIEFAKNMYKKVTGK